jgi:hypothetical protein
MTGLREREREESTVRYEKSMPSKKNSNCKYF